jgi:hypothetical protein
MSSRLMMSGSRTTSTGVFRGSAEETLNALLDAESDRLCNVQRYERSEVRRKLQTKRRTLCSTARMLGCQRWGLRSTQVMRVRDAVPHGLS